MLHQVLERVQLLSKKIKIRDGNYVCFQGCQRDQNVPNLFELEFIILIEVFLVFIIF
jgi:hypothetical protein